ncbi:MAG: multifunctional oxoglutarate decarboxylase/oxoglutarate dehydrogenase thiamine pyrophosphate-binding subunit/dihydrolipoyllysine-residue succinyltransferase subunit [Acidobacteria bacterium]|nr:multifunctional oxoglutarate decarboxylase/oxoglutarate dehydrogenase thiamine pyrophosphate-binding subunit/dihydrolipoyllysine-residue succinyltransferase subunit [Acidobacteriota bacterium]
MLSDDSNAAKERIADTRGGNPADESSKALPSLSDTAKPLHGGDLRVFENMEASLEIPTATSYRSISVKLLEENRRIINEYLEASGRGKVSFTHIIAWAIVQSIRDFPDLNSSLDLVDGSPYIRKKTAVNMGIAMDYIRKDGTRTLIVPNIKNVDKMSFPQFFQAYDTLIERMRKGSILSTDFQNTTITLSNPGTVGTLFSVPRLMKGQGAVIATGSIGYPSEYHAWDSRALSRLGLSKVMAVSCTYDHRIIQGAQSGEFLGRIQNFLLGHDGFYEQIFEEMELPAVPIQWARDPHPSMAGSPFGFEGLEKQTGVLKLINSYRVRGHLIANLDPLAEHQLYHPELDFSNYGLTLWDLDREFSTGGLGSLYRGTLRQILSVLRDAYCKNIGVEYRHIQDPDEKTWIQEHIEPEESRLPIDPKVRLRILKNLVNAEGFEKYLHTRFVGHKRFSLEGAETTIPVLAAMLAEAARIHVSEAVIGMAHRGRLNVFANIIGMPLVRILSEFEEITDPLSILGSGDVRYHLGASGEFASPEGDKILVSIAPNPSHLEWVNPVVEGIVRAKQDRRNDALGNKILPILIHGDAAFAGQGVVWETINLSQLYGYRTGGTIHIIINNQIGFTTSPQEARSSPYPTDLARSIQAPVFHVNGDDPDSAVRAALMAVAYRFRFNKDVVLDIFCYRRHGHNEADEPGYTQPLLYKKIAEKASVISLYGDKLLREGILAQETVDQWRRQMHECMEAAYSESRKGEQHFQSDVPLAVTEEDLQEFQPSGGTAVDMAMLQKVALALSSIPEDFRLHPKLVAFMAKRRELTTGDPPIDWSFAEALAFGTLVYEGTPVRLSGQDCSRGTFSQRHAVLTNLETGLQYIPLEHISKDQARFDVFDSLLSEAAVLGFEFGYSAADPLALVLWEAQFGDFANSAQVIIDNFIATSEIKWQQGCDLVLLLPHGYEGQGPEHSSARLERFLALCAEDNLRVCCPTTPAQYFHLLRRQMRDAKRMPLVAFTPKSILRHPKAVSKAQTFVNGLFELALDDPNVQDPSSIRRILLCTGKVYYELLGEQERRQHAQTAIIRVEQLFPFPEWILSKALKPYSHVREIFWVQEEPQNMGAWHFVSRHIPQFLPIGCDFRYVGRPERASPASGSYKRCRQEQATLVHAAFE